MIGASLIVIAFTIFAIGRDGLAFMLAIGLALQALTYLSTPLVAVIATRDLARSPDGEITFADGEHDLEQVSA